MTVNSASASKRALGGGVSMLAALSFLGARGCVFAGDVSLGDNPGAGALMGGAPAAGGAPATGGAAATGGASAAEAGQGGETMVPAVGGANQARGDSGTSVGQAGHDGQPAASGGSGDSGSGGMISSGGMGGLGGAPASAGASGGGTSGAGGTGGGGSATVEDDGADCDVPALPDFSALPDITQLPDPFTKLDGTRVERASEWRCRREELLRQAEMYAFGTKPAPPEHVRGTVTENEITVEVEDGARTASFSAKLTLPSSGQPPYPVLISYGTTTLDARVIDSAGVAVVTYDPDAVGNPVRPRGASQQGVFYDLYDGGSTTGLLVAWSWGMSRLIDVVQQSDGSLLQRDAFGVSGCSMYGKGAFLAGALDQRVALTMPIESGTAGVPIWRGIALSDSGPTGGEVLSLSETYSQAPWFADAFQPFTAAATRAPIDTHDIVALIAPRGLFVMDNANIDELSSQYGYVATLAGAEVYAALGARDNVSYQSNYPASEGTHCSPKSEMEPYVRANLLKFLSKTGNGAGTIDVAPDAAGNLGDWRDWTTPTLN